MNRQPAIKTLALLLAGTLSQPASGETATPTPKSRGIARNARLLSSDEFGGRGLGSPGLRRAADHVRGEFASLGLKTDALDGDAFQRFQVTISTKLGDDNHAAVVGVDDAGGPTLDRLKPGEDYNPLAIGGAGEFGLPLVFAGYGITAPEAEYDDYAGLDVEGRAVIVLRHEPQQGNPHSAFNGTDHSRHAPFRAKVSNAVQHGAAAILFTTDAFEIDKRIEQWEKRIATAEKEIAEAEGDDLAKAQKRLDRFRKQLERERDPLLDFARAGQTGDRDVPILACRPSVIDRWLKAAGKPSLRELEARIDRTLKPASFALADTRIVGRADVVREQAEVANVIAVLPGGGPNADETLVIGANLDHLGRGSRGSAKPGSEEVHNGADDNASGIAALLDTAARLAGRAEPLDRTVVFIAFTGEENGLLGSAHYAREPLRPLDQTVAMLNFDMVGRLRENELIVNGVGTAEEFESLVEQTNEAHGFSLTTTIGGFGPSDHASFYAKQVPVLHFFTGLHTEYHKPADDFDLLNLAGIERVSRFATEVAVAIADAPQRVTYVEVAGPSMPQGKTDPRPYFGSIPDFAGGGGGYAISGVAAGSPAGVAGLAGGDLIVRLGEYKIGNLDDFDNALRKFTAGDKVTVVVRRDGAERSFEVVLDPPR